MIKIICVGKLKERFWESACLEYLKRIKKYHKLQIIELKDSNIDKEKDEIIKYLGKKEFIICLNIEGKQMDSETFSKKMDIWLTNHNITFIIGGSFGIHNEIKKMSNFSLSFSLLTFPHQLFRVILLEQIYRCFRIINKETYHK